MQAKTVLLMIGLLQTSTLLGAESSSASESDLSPLSLEFLQFLGESEDDAVAWEYWINAEIEENGTASVQTVEEGGLSDD